MLQNIRVSHYICKKQSPVALSSIIFYQSFHVEVDFGVGWFSGLLLLVTNPCSLLLLVVLLLLYCVVVCLDRSSKKLSPP